MKPTYATTLCVYCLLLIALWTISVPSLSLASSVEQNRQEIAVTTFEFKGVLHVVAKTLVHFTPQYFLGLMSRSNENCAWMDKCVSVTILSQHSATEQMTQTHINAPWPFTDREMVVTSRSEYNKTTNTLTLFIEDASNDLPKHPNRVRMTEVYGEWHIKPHNKLFELSYTGTANPNGNIPQSFALRFLKNSTRQTFENLQTLGQSELNDSLNKARNE